MKNRPDQEKIDQLKRDVQILGYTQGEIGSKMKGMGSANLSSYLNGSKTITWKFLEKFYAAWGDELKLKYEERKAAYLTDTPPEIIAREEAQSYPEKNYRDDFIEFMQKNYTALVNQFDKMTDSNYKLVVNNEKLVETNQKLAEAVLSQSKRKTDNQLSPDDLPSSQKEASPKKSHKKPET